MLNSQASLDSGSRSGWRLWLGLGGVRAFSFDGLWYFAISRKVNWGTVSLSSNSLFIICGHYGYLRIFSLRDTVTVRLSKQGKVGPEVGTHIPADKLNRYLEMYHSLLPGIISIRGWKKTVILISWHANLSGGVGMRLSEASLMERIELWAVQDHWWRRFRFHVRNSEK